MTTQTAPEKQAKDVHEIITSRIIEQLEKGVVPWRKPWTTGGLPQNLLTKRPYRGLNLLLLSSLGYAQNYFLTWRQIKAFGGTIKKGEKPFPVIFWKFPEQDEENPKKPPILRYYTVYNIEQCEDIAESKLPPPLSERTNDPIESCFEMVEKMPNRPPIKHKENRAYYQPFHDFINMPKMSAFIDSESYYDTLFHELIHSTGHKSRLDRKELPFMKSLGADAYSLEELIAEIGACFLAPIAGIVDLHFDNNVAYINHWLGKLKDDSKFIIYASAKAQKAVDYILNEQRKESKINDQIEDMPE